MGGPSGRASSKAVFESLDAQPLSSPTHAHHNRLDTVLTQRLNEDAIVLDGVRVDQVAAPTLRDDPAPRDREAVRVRSRELEEGDVLAPAPVRVDRYVSIGVVLDLSRGVREGVPDGGRAALDIRRAFDLVARWWGTCASRSPSSCRTEAYLWHIPRGSRSEALLSCSSLRPHVCA